MESYYIGGGPNLRIAVGIITLTILLLASGVSTVTAEITVTPEIIPNDLVIDAPPKAMAGDTIWINVTAGGNVIDNVSIMFDTTDIGNTDKHGSLTYTLPKNLNGIHNITATKMDYAKAVKSIEIVSGKTWTVNASGNADYTRIQDAIDNASAGDTILVYSATYYENVNVTKQLILKGIDTGRGEPIVDANKSGSAIILSVGNSMLEGFSAVNSGYNDHGIYLKGNNNTLSNNSVSNNKGDGIYLSGNNNTLISNNVSNNGGGGIYLGDLWGGSNYNTLNGNNISNNNGAGIGMSYSDHNTLSNNTLSNNTLSNGSIFLYYSSNNVLSGNNAKNNDYGISLFGSCNNTLRGNNASNNNNYGISLWYYSNNNMLSNNHVSNNNYSGLDLSSSSNNIIYNNFFNNINNIRLDGFVNRWNITKTNSTNIIGGPYLGGNFWAYPNGTGFSQTCIDTDSDRICDSQYVFDKNNIDYLPLVYIPTPSGDVVSRYAGSDGIIQKSEAVQAVMDYFSGLITKQETISVVMAYFNR